jgi:hypothetical protein
MIGPERVGVCPFASDKEQILFQTESGQDILDEVGAIKTCFDCLAKKTKKEGKKKRKANQPV